MMAGNESLAAPMQASRLKVGEVAEAYWFGSWYPCTILRWLPQSSGAPDEGDAADVVWMDGSITHKVPERMLRCAVDGERGTAVSRRKGSLSVSCRDALDKVEALPNDSHLVAHVVLTLGPTTLRVVAFLVFAASGILLLTLMIISPPEEDTWAWWTGTGLVIFAILLQGWSENLARKQKKKLDKLAENSPVDDRLKRLLLKREATRARTRHAMGDIVDTAREKVFDIVHNCAAFTRGETAAKATLWNNTADVLHRDSESNIEWGTEWRAVGATMHDRHGTPLTVRFGVNMRKLYFHLDYGYLNGASYGATPKPVLEGQSQWARIVQRNPVAWRFKALPLRLAQAEAQLSSLLGSDPDDTKLLINANAATSTILKSLPWQLGDRFLIFNIDYDATKLAGKWVERHHGVELYEIEISLPITDDDLCELVEKKLKAIKKNKEPMPILANFCHVTSKTAYIFPAKRLTHIFHKFGISVMVDGAQAAGHIDINVGDIGADWYYGTVHKWLYSCPGVAFIVTQPHKQRCTFPLTVAYLDGDGYWSEFSYQGLQDFSPWLSVIDAFDFIEKICGGLEEVKRYCRTQARECAKLLSEKWGTTPVQRDQEHYGSMPVMPLPGGKNAKQLDAVKVMGYLSVKYGITAFLLVIDIAGTPTLCVRCTCQIYTDSSDWEALGEAIKALRGNYSGLNVLKEMSSNNPMT